MTQVMRLKKRLLDPNRKTRLKILAKQYGVTMMTLHRIKTGENWGHIKV
jgi:DNA-binding Xre family transcriptional regulator